MMSTGIQLFVYIENVFPRYLSADSWGFTLGNEADRNRGCAVQVFWHDPVDVILNKYCHQK